ncbi:TrkA C-terminal domain-containing protein [Haloarchaeobius sp. DYHT-AS-18]|uniref:Lrp/AsnC family transcriptional regulator n=1 Tax=Haloarchaeobius sp. DYHT-AS-18 TaxID=3446117 RepID=UPI003EB9280D
MSDRIDEIDRRIIYRLMGDARNVSAPMIAEEMNVSAGTIRNRIAQLEERGVIQGYHASVDFERTGAPLTNLFICRAPVPEREAIAEKALQIPGVVNIRQLMTGGANLHVVAVGRDMADVTRIARALAALGVDIEDEQLVQKERTRPYEPFGPEEDARRSALADMMQLAGGAEVVEVSVSDDAPLAGLTLTEAADEGHIGDDVLVVAIERDGAVITPKGDVTVEPGDLVTVFSRSGASQAVLETFTGE